MCPSGYALLRSHYAPPAASASTYSARSSCDGIFIGTLCGMASRQSLRVKQTSSVWNCRLSCQFILEIRCRWDSFAVDQTSHTSSTISRMDSGLSIEIQKLPSGHVLLWHRRTRNSRMELPPQNDAPPRPSLTPPSCLWGYPICLCHAVTLSNAGCTSPS